MFHVMITNEVPVTILQAYFSLPRLILKVCLQDDLLGQIYVQKLVACNSASNQENFKGELCLNVITPCTIIVVVLQLRDVPKTVIRVNQNGGHKQSLGGGGARPPYLPPPRSDDTEHLVYTF